MLRFITGNLTTIDGVSIYPIISLLVFVLFFTVMLYRVIRMKKTEISELGKMPFEEEVETTDYTLKD